MRRVLVIHPGHGTPGFSVGVMEDAMRDESAVRRDLKIWESQLDLHLQHCDVCNEDAETYCKTGCEISYMVTSLMVEQMRIQVRQQVEEQERLKQERAHEFDL